jgi:hypothetical protein
MQPSKYIIIPFIILMSIIFCGQTAQPGDSGATVRFVIGDVQIQSTEQTSWQTLKLNASVREGDRIKTALNSRVELEMPDGTQLKISENTVFDVNEIKTPEKDKEDKQSFTVWAGSIWAKFTKLVTTRQERRIDSPSAVVAIRGTTLEMDVDQNQGTRVRVEEGSVQVTSKDVAGEVTVDANQETFVARGSAPSQPRAFRTMQGTQPESEGAFLFNLNLPSVMITDPAALVAGMPVTGRIPPGGQLSADQQPLQVNPDGSFNVRLRVNEGLNKIDLTASSGGQKQTKEIKVYVNTKKPEIRLSSPLVTGFYNNRSYSLSGGVFDPTPGDKVTVKINNETVAELIGRGAFNRTIILNEGENTIRVVAVDRSGNSSEISQQLFLDTVKPILTVTEPAEQVSYRREPPPPPNVRAVRIEQTVRGIVIDPEPSSKIKRMVLNGKEIKPRSDGSFTTTIPLIRGENRLTFEIEDMAGNMLRDNSRIVRVP